MKKILLLLTILISSNVFADWILLGGSEDMSSVYVDLDTILKEGKKTKFWRKVNYVNTVSGMLSSRTYEEVDCKKRTIITLSFTAFSELNFEGKMLSSFEPPPKIEYIAPDTVDELIYEYVCK